MPKGSLNRRDVVKEGVIEPHQLPGAASSLPSTPVLCETQEQHHRSVEDGQRNSGDLYKQNGGNSLTSPVQSGYFLVGLEPTTEHISVHRAPAREGEYSGRPGVKGDERQMRLDVKPSCFQSNQSQMGPCEIDIFASRLMRQLPRFFSWKPDPEAEGTDAFSQDWSAARGYANPSWCLIARCLSQIKQQMTRLVVITPLWNTQPWFPTILSLLED